MITGAQGRHTSTWVPGAAFRWSDEQNRPSCRALYHRQDSCCEARERVRKEYGSLHVWRYIGPLPPQLHLAERCGRTSGMHEYDHMSLEVSVTGHPLHTWGPGHTTR